MNDFKIGDEVWFLIEEHGWGSSPVMIGNLNIRKEKVTDIFSEHLQVEHVEGAFCLEDAYKAKEEVIALLHAMIARLQELKDD